MKPILLWLFIHQYNFLSSFASVYGGEYPSDCDIDAANECSREYDICVLYTGPVGTETRCRCAKQFYGDCLRKANCMLQYIPDGSMVYTRQCVSFLMENNCPDPLMCAVNCASEGNIDRNTTRIVPFNNYGKYYLRLRLCNHVVHPQKLQRYGIVYPPSCGSFDEFQICSRWIAPNEFVPVALPINTTYMMVDYCTIKDGNKYCLKSDPSPTRLYGGRVLFPSSFDVPKSLSSICSSDDDCLGTFCDFSERPNTCSPKSLKQVGNSGAHYFDEPFS